MIRSLSEDLRNKISAGEVVERPASVVKELLENSIDAGATAVSIVIEKGGHQLIQVTDDGHGITADDLPRAFERYSTSKINSVEDLFRINTLGFRGEALASIASVSDVKIVSCADGEGGAGGAEMIMRKGKASEIIPAAAEQGTQITVTNLFYNTPARRKFLKSPQVELRHIVQMTRRFALAYPEIHFLLVADGKEILKVLPEKLEDRIAALFDPTYRTNILPVNIAKGDYVISGFIGNLNLVRSRPGEQYIFLNRRFIKNRLLNSAVYSGFQSLTKRGEYPFFTLNMGLPLDQVDVNVHPMKIEVRFKDEWRIYHVLKSGIESALRNILDTIPDFGKSVPGEPAGNQLSLSTRTYTATTPFPTGKGGPGRPGPAPGGGPPESETPASRTVSGLERAKSYVSTLAARKGGDQEIDVENIWQVHNKYIVSQISSGLVIIDQHVAHERVLFEEALAAFDASPMASQTLLFPETLTFSPDEYSVLLDILPYLEKIGFRMREVGQNKVLVEAVPSEMGWGNEKQIIRNIIDHYLSHQKQYSSFQENLAASFACHAAVKAGDQLTREEMQELVNRLFGTKHPYYCPHGRPIIVQLTLDEIDKRFERL
ncbi:MAG: DNA mismatch repair endonuclease MutL [FCB group bacterium]|nr:DNA mismatch repair endonuclease MutL [FCB group bacterium]